MTITETAEYARQCFIKRYPDKNKRGMIIIAFMREELQMSSSNIKELMTDGRTPTPENALKEDYAARLFLWIYVNYLSTPKYDQEGN
jgi:hypothetical protein